MDDTRPLAAAASILIAMAVIGFIDNYVVVIAETGGLWQFHVTRTLMALPMIWVMARLGFGTLRPSRPRAVAGRSLLIATGLMIYFGALAFLPISEVAAGLFTSPIWVLVVSVAFLGLRVGPVRAIAALVGFAGVLLVLRPDAGGASAATFVPVFAGLFYALGALATRGWCAGESTLSLLLGVFLALAVWGLVGLGILAVLKPEVPSGADGFILRAWVTPTGPFLFWTFVQAVGSIVALWFLIKGYQLGEASFSAVFEYSLLIFASAWAFALRGEAIDGYAAVGILLIIGSGAAIALRGREIAA